MQHAVPPFAAAEHRPGPTPSPGAPPRADAPSRHRHAAPRSHRAVAPASDDSPAAARGAPRSKSPPSRALSASSPSVSSAPAHLFSRRNSPSCCLTRSRCHVSQWNLVPISTSPLLFKCYRMLVGSPSCVTPNVASMLMCSLSPWWPMSGGRQSPIKTRAFFVGNVAARRGSWPVSERRSPGNRPRTCDARMHRLDLHGTVELLLARPCLVALEVL